MCVSRDVQHTLHTSITILFFFNDTATTEIYTLSLHDALPICGQAHAQPSARRLGGGLHGGARIVQFVQDRKSTRLNSSHLVISYAVFCLKKKKDTYYSASDPPPPAHHTRHSTRDTQRKGDDTP